MKKIALALLAAPLLLGNASSEIFKDQDRSWYDKPEVVSASILAQLANGMNRRQVRELIGTPHFNEGVMVRNWNYLFDIEVDGQTILKSCQLRIDFVKGRIVRQRWDKPDCGQQIK
ncbi:MAG: outer membrane protein assembly factor BamE [Sphingorhabdus sp.]